MKTMRFKFKGQDITLKFEHHYYDNLYIFINGEELFHHTHDYDEEDERFLNEFFFKGKKTFVDLIEGTEDEAYQADDEEAIKRIEKLLGNFRENEYRKYGIR